MRRVRFVQVAAGRTASAPRGLLFVAGVMAKGQSAAGEGAAVLMDRVSEALKESLWHVRLDLFDHIKLYIPYRM